MSVIRVLLVSIVLLLALALLLRERLTTPSDELKVVARCYAAVESAERDYKARFKKYATAVELSAAAPLIGSECGEDYVLNVQPNAGGFVIQISPARPRSEPASRRISLYSGGDGNIRIKYGGEPADQTTAVFAKFRHYLPR